MKKVLVLVIAIALATASYIYITSRPDPSIVTMPKVKAEIGTGTFTLYAPTDGEELQKGLSVFDKIDPNEGMIFRGLLVGTQTFWMKDMKFDIDIIWVNKDNQVIHIVYNASKDSYPNKFMNPVERPSSYVIEINAGLAEKHGIAPGSQVTIN